MADVPARKYPFVVNNVSHEASIEKAVQGLHNMVELGKRAQFALDALERDGYYDKVVIRAEMDPNDRSRVPSLRKGRFPAYCSVSQEDMPGLSGLALSLGNGYKSQYGGHSCIEYNLTLSGEGVRETKGVLSPLPIKDVDVGSIRVSGRTISYLAERSAWQLTTKMKKLEPMLEKLKQSGATERLATTLSHIIVKHDGNQREFSQNGADLFRQSREWLVQDGHTLRMFEDVIRSLHILWVMDE